MKNILIRVPGSTVSIKDYVLDNYSNEFFNEPYSENKKFINNQIRVLVKGNEQEKNISQEITKFLINTTLAEARCKEENLEIDDSEVPFD